MSTCIFCGQAEGQDDIGDRRAVTCCDLAVALASEDETVTISHDDLVTLSGRLHRHVHDLDRILAAINEAQ